jgi:hypothetical protein
MARFGTAVWRKARANIALGIIVLLYAVVLEKKQTMRCDDKVDNIHSALI